MADVIMNLQIWVLKSIVFSGKSLNMNRINDKKEPLIAIVIVMALFVISAGWVNGRMAGTFYVSQLRTDVTLAETITVYEYELINPALEIDKELGGEEYEPVERDLEEEYRKVPKVDIPAGSTSRVFEIFEFYYLRNSDMFTVKKPSAHSIRAVFNISDDKSVHVTFTDGKERLQSPGNYVDISKLESSSELIAAYDEALDDWFINWNRCQKAGVIIGVIVTALISLGFYLAKRGYESVRNSTLFGFSITIIILCFLNLLFVLAYLFPNMK